VKKKSKGRPKKRNNWGKERPGKGKTRVAKTEGEKEGGKPKQHTRGKRLAPLNVPRRDKGGTEKNKKKSGIRRNSTFQRKKKKGGPGQKIGKKSSKGGGNTIIRGATAGKTS